MVDLWQGGVRLHCREYGGSGRPVLLLHGLAGHSGEWRRTAEALAGEYRVLALDLRGHGQSTRRPADVSRAAYVADVATVIRELGGGPVALVGQSFGAHTAMLTAAAHPDLVDRLVLVEGGVGGAGGASVEAVEGWLRSWPAPFATRADAERFFGGPPSAGAWVDGLEERADGLWPRFDVDILVDALRPVAAAEHWPDWERLTCPTLLVLGERGIIGAAEIAEMIARRPETRQVTIPAAGHDLHLERPDEWARVLARYLGTGTA
ncbi:alpha/beta hydrolase [Phytohabitans flavus]|uniref:AB hydrolase-1 domain-containing protein n=1 Tax=Phytohabitans flavus TaxID=1076124 RepID=A0A6F8Y465_9ACTN|nr:alpha/beta hydrolase [Phytohabitans flavus]BCB80850.1 hypothetical protein Pflav_072600 [Phytohabitans flavus]